MANRTNQNSSRNHQEKERLLVEAIIGIIWALVENVELTIQDEIKLKTLLKKLYELKTEEENENSRD